MNNKGKNIKSKNSKGNKPPYWLAGYPFKPHEKKPCLLKKGSGIPRIYGNEPNDVELCLHVSTDKITCSEFHVQPGRYFDPPDIHSGDEVYYILRGKATIFNPDNGTVQVAEEGDFFLIPSGMWHQTFNFFNEKLEVLTAFGKNMLAFDKGWPEIRYPGTPDYFKGTSNEITSRLNMLRNRAPDIKSPPQGRIQSREMSVIRRGEGLNLIRGEKHHILMSFYVSNETIHSGIMTIPPRGRSDPETHNGDEVIYCLTGSISVLIAGENKDGRSIEANRYIVESGDRFLIPEAVKHQYINFSSENVELLFSIATDL